MAEKVEEKGDSAVHGTAEGLLQLVSFCIGAEEFGVDILRVQEINRMLAITRVPNAPPHVEGVISLRGKVIPVINLRRRLGLESKEFDKDTRIIVVDIRGTVVGFLVDAVREVLRISRDVTEPPPSLVAGIDAEYITALGKVEDRLLIILDLERLLAPGEEVHLAQTV